MEEFMDKETCVAFYEDAKVNARHSRIEARFEKICIEATCDMTETTMEALWGMAERIESFLESKRAEVKDGNV